MKKTVVITIIFAICVSLVSCGGAFGRAFNQELNQSDKGGNIDVKECNNDGLDYKLNTGFMYEKEMIYINQEFRYSLRMPEDIYIHCDIQELNGGSQIIFLLKNSGDMVMEIVTVEDSNFKEQIGMNLLNSNNGFTTYIQMPTCGTLNDENQRELWEKLSQEVSKISSGNLTYIE